MGRGRLTGLHVSFSERCCRRPRAEVRIPIQLRAACLTGEHTSVCHELEKTTGLNSAETGKHPADEQPQLA